MQAVRKSLPSDTKAVGYISAQDLPNGSYTIEQTTAFSLTRFALAPVTVHRGIKEAWIVGYFRSPNFEGWLKEKLGGASQITDLGFGIYLIHRVQ